MNSLELALIKLAKMYPKQKAGAGASGFLGTLTRDACKSLNLQNEGTRVPRFIYHLTSKENAQTIFTKGKIEPRTNDLLFGNGIFAIDLQNYFKRWQLQDLLDFFKAKNISECTILKIPTNKLDLSLLRIRDSDILTSGLDFHVLINRVRNQLMEKYNTDIAGLCRLIETNNAVKEDAIKQLRPFIEKSLTSSGLSPKLKAKKKAIEFMYPDAISTDGIQQLGTTSMEGKTPKEIFIELLRGFPEEKSIEILT